jgi:hypothetical protein
MGSVSYTDPATGQTGNYWVEQGVPGNYAARGATTVTAYQQMAAQDLSDKQIQAQKDIAAQQQTFNEQQFQAQQDQYAQQQKQVQEQADRQSQYDTGRAATLADSTNQINQAFSRFSPDYFKGYASDYLAKAQDQIDYQRRQATKDLGFQLARQGISSSQAGINQTGLIDETAGRATAEQTDAAQQAAAGLQTDVANARQNLGTQVVNAESIGSPIAGSTIEDVNSALQTQRNAVSGVATTAGDVASSLQAVPTVNTLGSLFSGVLGAGGNFLGGVQSGQILGKLNAGLSGTNPSGGSSTRFS